MQSKEKNQSIGSIRKERKNDENIYRKRSWWSGLYQQRLVSIGVPAAVLVIDKLFFQSLSSKTNNNNGLQNKGKKAKECKNTFLTKKYGI
jgi:hypothetical protein